MTTKHHLARHATLLSAPRALAVALGVGLAAVVAVPAAAQQDAAPLAAGAFTEAQIDAFVEVALEVAAIRDDYASRLDATADADEQAALIAEGNAAMLEAVDAAPQITVEDYVAIGEAATADPDLGRHIVMLMEERAASDG